MAGVTLYDRATRRAQAFATPDDAAAAIQAGTHAPAKGTQLDVEGADGAKGTIDSAKVGELLASGGRLLSSEEATRAQIEARRGGGVKGALNFAAAQSLAAARGATAGGSDAAITEGARIFGGKTQGEIRSFVKDVKDLHGTTSTLSEIGGATAAAIAGGYGGGAAGAAGGEARLVRALPGAGIDALGMAAEGAVSRALPQATSTLGRAGNAALRLGVRGATEGALYGAGQETSEAVLGDHAVNAEKVYLAALHGGALGGVTGGVLGGVGSLAASGAKGLARTLAPKLAEEAEIQAVRAFSPPRHLEKHVERLPGGEKGLGRFILDEGVHSFGSKPTGASTLERVEAVLEKTVDDLERFYQRADSGGFKPPSHLKIAKRVNDEVIKPAWEMRHLDASPVNAAQGALESLAEIKPQNFSEWRAFRARIDDAIKWNPPAPGAQVNQKQEALKAIRSILADEVAGAAEAASPGARAELQKLNARFRYANTLQDLTDYAVTREGSTNAISLREAIVGAGGLATGEPITGLIAAGVMKAGRERAATTGAVVLDKIAQFGAIRGAVEQADAKIAGAVAGAVNGRMTSKVKTAPARDTAPSREPIRIQYDRARRDVMASKPEDAVERSSAIGPDAPLHRAALASHVAGVNAYLQTQLPANDRLAPGAGLAATTRDRVTETQMRDFVAKYNAAKTPQIALDDMAKGRVSPAAIDALRATSPGVYAEMQAGAVRLVVEREADGRPLTYQERLRLGILLDVPTDPTLVPDALGALQSAARGNGAGSSDKPAPQRRSSSQPLPNPETPSRLDTIAEKGPGGRR